MEGLDGSQVVVVNDYYLKQDQVEDEVVVLGGGLAGCEAAIHLAQEGKCVTVVEMRDEVAVDANIRHRPILLTELADKNVRLCTGYRGLRVTREGVICLNPEGKEELVPGKRSSVQPVSGRAGKSRTVFWEQRLISRRSVTVCAPPQSRRQSIRDITLRLIFKNHLLL